MTTARFLVVSVACLALLACSDRPTRVDMFTNPAPCPSAGVLFDAARLVQFHGDVELFNVGFTGEILGVRSLCRYRGGEPIEADLEIDFAFGRGPAAGGTSHVYPYFVAVTRRDSVVIARESFSVEARFGRDEVTSATDRIRSIVIPRASSEVAGTNFEIIVGFELNEQELEYNRSGVRFRQSAGDVEPPGR